MGDFKDLMLKIHIFENTHRKDILKEKQDMIFNLYDGFLEEIKDKKNMSTKIKAVENDITVLIHSSENLCLSEYDYYFNTLMCLADAKNIKIVDGKIKLVLWFRCWEYLKQI